MTTTLSIMHLAHKGSSKGYSPVHTHTGKSRTVKLGQVEIQIKRRVMSVSVERGNGIKGGHFDAPVHAPRL